MAAYEDLFDTQIRIAEYLYTLQAAFVADINQIEQELQTTIAAENKRSVDTISSSLRVRDTTITHAERTRDTSVKSAPQIRDAAIRSATQARDASIKDAERTRDAMIRNAPQIRNTSDASRLFEAIRRQDRRDGSPSPWEISSEFSQFGEYGPALSTSLRQRETLKRVDHWDKFVSSIGGFFVAGLVAGIVMWVYANGQSKGQGASIWWVAMPLIVSLVAPALWHFAASLQTSNAVSMKDTEIIQIVNKAIAASNSLTVQAKLKYQTVYDEAQAQYTTSVTHAEAQCTTSIAEAEDQYQQAYDAAHAQHTQTWTQAEAAHSQSTLLANKRYQSRRADCEAQHRQSIKVVAPQLDAYVAEVESAVLRLEDTVTSGWAPPTEVERYTEIGRINVVADSDRVMPVVVRMPDQVSLLFHSRGAQRAHVAESLLLRYLTSFPAGKLEFTLIDPVGLGRNVAFLMHLNDHRPQLINDRAWVEPQHIEKQLAKLSETMQNIIQKYLKTTYSTMAEYNEAAGEVEEPYRVLVVNNFPANFTSEALRHLVSIVQNGPKCGVHTVIAVDDSQEVPYKFNMADLESGCTVFRQTSSHQEALLMDVPGVRWWPFFPEEMPSSEVTQYILDVVGREAVENSVVQVPLSQLAPTENRWWTKNREKGLSVPIGVSGARKPQHLAFSTNLNEVSAMVVGRTGSGKSTLMHTAITSLALAYSPKDLELYLIDSKQGVEFQIYITHKLPHAKVISVETEPEFAMSVLQHLSRELERRGALFRNATNALGTRIEDIEKYNASKQQSIPHIVIFADEFHILFREAGPLSDQATKTIHDLISQGRAFGMHVVLGTQTLQGQGHISSAALGQMPIRIALQCSDADSRLILADDNPAARLLDRPGEAIYNDENGRIEGNNRFQTAWLTREEQDAYLDRLATMAETRFPDLPEPIVFEGNATANAAQNRPLAALLHATTKLARKPVVDAWVGDPIAITDPAAAPLRTQAGANLLVIGQDEEASYGVLATSVIGIARQHELFEDKAKITVVDMSASDHPHAELFPSLGAMFPDIVRVAGRRSVVPEVERTYEELERRLALEDGGTSSFDRIYVVIVGLPRARDLREDEDRSFSGGFFGDEKPSKTPNQMLHTILKDGPEFGIHIIAWADTLSNLSRIVNRGGLREFDLRVVMQTSADDSSALVDSQAASNLGPNRALLYSEEKGTALKFRPYGVPSQTWLEQVRQRPVAS